MIYFREMFLKKAIIHFVLMFSMYQCLFIDSLVFGKEKLIKLINSLVKKRSSVKIVNSPDLVVDAGFFENFFHKPF